MKIEGPLKEVKVSELGDRGREKVKILGPMKKDKVSQLGERGTNK